MLVKFVDFILVKFIDFILVKSILSFYNLGAAGAIGESSGGYRGRTDAHCPPFQLPAHTYLFYSLVNYTIYFGDE